MIIGRRVVHLPRVSSTMDEIDVLAASGEPEGVVVVADEQTTGRGRAGRAWHAPAGTSIFCSILLRPSVPADRLTTLPLLAGVAVAEAIEAVASVHCRLKWPNDVWIDGQKVAGILLTSRAAASGVAHVNVGIGINVNVLREALPDGATSLHIATGTFNDCGIILQSLIYRLDAAYVEFCRVDGRPDLTPWRRRAAMVGEVVHIEANGVTHHGRMRGVDDSGALILEQADGTSRRIIAGDLTRGPRSAPQGDPVTP